MSRRGPASAAPVDQALSLIPSLGSLSLNKPESNQGADRKLSAPHTLAIEAPARIRDPDNDEETVAWMNADGTYNAELLDRYTRAQNQDWVTFYPPAEDAPDAEPGTPGFDATWTSFYPEGRDLMHKKPHFMQPVVFRQKPATFEDAIQPMMAWMEKNDAPRPPPKPRKGKEQAPPKPPPDKYQFPKYPIALKALQDKDYDTLIDVFRELPYKGAKNQPQIPPGYILFNRRKKPGQTAIQKKLLGDSWTPTEPRYFGPKYLEWNKKEEGFMYTIHNCTTPKEAWIVYLEFASSAANLKPGKSSEARKAKKEQSDQQKAALALVDLNPGASGGDPGASSSSAPDEEGDLVREARNTVGQERNKELDKLLAAQEAAKEQEKKDREERERLEKKKEEEAQKQKELMERAESLLGGGSSDLEDLMEGI